VRSAVSALGSVDAWRVFLKPGKPLAYGRVGQTPFIGLPGNPVSTFMTFQLFVRPVLRALHGADAGLDEPPLRLPLSDAWRAGDRPEFVRVRRVRSASGVTELAVFPNQNSGLLSSLVWADGVALIPPDQPLPAGCLVDYFPFEGWLS
jgi:molybdopterin molybdotransferase